MAMDEQQFQSVLEKLTRIADGLERLAQTQTSDSKINEDIEDAAKMAGIGAKEEAMLSMGTGGTTKTALGALGILKKVARTTTPGLLGTISQQLGQEFTTTQMQPLKMTEQYARELAESGIDEGNIRKLTEEYYKRVRTWKFHELQAIEDVQKRHLPLPTYIQDFLTGVGHASTKLVERNKKYYDDMRKNWALQGD